MECLEKINISFPSLLADGQPHKLFWAWATEAQRTPTEKEPPRTSARLKAADKSKSINLNWEKLTCLAEAADKADYAKKPSLDLSTVENEEGDGMKAKATRRLRSKRVKIRPPNRRKKMEVLKTLVQLESNRRKEKAESSSKEKKDEGNIGSATSVVRQQERDHESLSYEKGKEDVKLKKNYPSGGLLIDLNGDPEPQTSDEQSTQVASAYGCSSAPAKKLNPVWFSLIASKEQRGDPLPQIAKSQIRIKDRSMPVCYVNKYLVHKPNLKDESECSVKKLSSLNPDLTKHVAHLVDQFKLDGIHVHLQRNCIWVGWPSLVGH